MIEELGQCKIWGSSFSPSAFQRESGIQLDSATEVGDRHPRSGSIFQYGYGIFHCASESSRISEFLEEWSAVLLQAGAEEIIVHLDLNYTGQCNCEVPDRLLKSIVRAGAFLTFSCYDVEE